MKQSKTPILAVDGVIVEKKSVLLVKRAIEPFKSYWCLPGGHVEYGETVEQAVKREMKEELGVSVKIKKLVGVYSKPKRDPRGHTVSIAFLLQKIRGRIHLSKEAAEFSYFALNKLPKKIGFDHRQIIKDARALMK